MPRRAGFVGFFIAFGETRLRVNTNLTVFVRVRLPAQLNAKPVYPGWLKNYMIFGVFYRLRRDAVGHIYKYLDNHVNPACRSEA